MQTKFKELKQIIEKNSSFAVFGHVNPDGDAIGSMLGLGGVLENMGKQVSYFTPTEPSQTFNYLPIQKIKTDFDFGQYNILVFTDFSAYSRVSKFLDQDYEYFKKNFLVVIDHHESEKLDIPADFVLKDTEAVSCSEFVREFIYSQFQEKITPLIATCLLTGQITDSGNFFYDEDSIRAFRNTTQMLEFGADKQKIQKNIFYNKTFGDLQILQVLMGRLQMKQNILWSWVEEKDLEKYQVEQESAKVVLSQMQKVQGYDVYLLLHFKDGNCKLHFRSNTIDVASLARKFDGGGHKSASGAILKDYEKTLTSNENLELFGKEIVDLILNKM